MTAAIATSSPSTIATVLRQQQLLLLLNSPCSPRIATAILAKAASIAIATAPPTHIANSYSCYSSSYCYITFSYCYYNYSSYYCNCYNLLLPSYLLGCWLCLQEVCDGMVHDAP